MLSTLARLYALVVSDLSKFFQREKVRDYAEGEMKIVNFHVQSAS
jgi:hypothetical protein